MISMCFQGRLPEGKHNCLSLVVKVTKLHPSVRQHQTKEEESSEGQRCKKSLCLRLKSPRGWVTEVGAGSESGSTMS